MGIEMLPRVVGFTDEERRAVRERVGEVAMSSSSVGDVVTTRNWQGVVDLVVSEYSDRLAYMVSDEIRADVLRREVLAATDVHYDFPAEPRDVTVGFVVETETETEDDRLRERDARRRCAERFPLAVAWQRGDEFWTQEDEMLFVAVSTVTERICDALFDARAVLGAADPGFTVTPGTSNADVGIKRERKAQEAADQARHILRNLTGELRWTMWKRCRGCAVDEICFVAMWHIGRVVDHYSPACANETTVETRDVYMLERNYWRSVPTRSAQQE